MAKSKRRINYGKLVFRSLFIFAIAYFSLTFYDQYKEMQDLQGRELILNQSLEKLQGEVDSLKIQTANSNTDEHIEKIAREHLRMVKNGEKIFVDLNKTQK